jgi:hypothetical protein
MKKKVVKLTEGDLNRIVKRVITEQQEESKKKRKIHRKGK